MKNLRKGFTLVELLVVIAVIGILFVVLISKVDFATDKAKETGVKTDFRSYQLSMEQVAREQTGFKMSATPTAGEVTYIVDELNKNLDQKLKIVDGGAGTATIAAEDAWGTAYTISFDGDLDISEGPAVTITSNGPNLAPEADDAEETDDITITTFYGPNGVESFTTGLSNNIEL